MRPDESERQPLTGRLVTVPAGEDRNHASIFNITLSPFLDHADKVVTFGRVVEGMDAVSAIRRGDRMNRVTIASQ